MGAPSGAPLSPGPGLFKPHSPGEGTQRPGSPPHRPAHLAPGPAAGPGTAMSRVPASTGPCCPGIGCWATPRSTRSSEERRAHRDHRDAGIERKPPKDKAAPGSDPPLGKNQRVRSVAFCRPCAYGARCWILEVCVLTRRAEKCDYFMTSILDSEYRCFIHSPTEATVIF